jgi:hypothetical protein
LGIKHIVIGIAALVVFIGGLVCGFLIANDNSNDINMPFDLQRYERILAEKKIDGVHSYNTTREENKINLDKEMLQWIAPLAKDSPKDRIKERNIKIYNGKVTIDVDNVILARFTDTKSMEPVLNKDTNALEVIPKDSSDIQVGDIISYKSAFSSGIIIHRVVEKDIDEKGTYFKTKGDNLNYIDPEKIRFAQIQRVVVGILY